jgi:hypothetical protein
MEGAAPRRPTYHGAHGAHPFREQVAGLPQDPESVGFAAVIEWINSAVARPEDWPGRPVRFAPVS